MKKTKYRIFLGLTAIALIAGGLLLAFFNSTNPVIEVVEANEYAVLYSDNTAEIIFRDTYDKQGVEIYRGKIGPLYINEEKSQHGFGPVRYILPAVTLVANTNDHAIFTFRNGERPGYSCDSDIFYVDRITRTAKVINTAVCIVKSLDEKTHTRFWTAEYFGFTEPNGNRFDIGVGNYATGEIIASTSVAIPVWTDGISGIGWYSINPSSVVANPEMTKVVFAFTAGPECGDSQGGCDTPAFIYSFDVETGAVQDVTPEKGVTHNTLYPSGNSSDHSMLWYQEGEDDSATGRFIIVSGGLGDNEPYAVIDVN